MYVVVECGEPIEHATYANVCDFELDWVQYLKPNLVCRRPAARVMRIKIMKLKVTVLAG